VSSRGHILRFGEIEQRGVALTPKGRALYDRLLNEAGTGKDNLTHQLHLQEMFHAFPDSEMLLRRQQLAYFRYRLTPSGEAHRKAIRPGDDPQPLIERGWVVAQPIIYEDFLPSARPGSFSQTLAMKRNSVATVTPANCVLKRRLAAKCLMSSPSTRKRKSAANDVAVCCKKGTLLRM
jgi:uncharacterized glyoxalase superfamily metalloenzyme YdcJ